MSQLIISDLHVSVNSKKILRGVNLKIASNQIHALMGPNGSGKSTLAAVLMGHPAYEVTQGEIFFNDQDLLALSPDERANLGLFLAFQYPVEVPGVKVQNFLRQAYQARFSNQPKKQFDKVIEFRKYLQKIAENLGIKPEFLSRGLNEGFSGGEKKLLEILQLAVFEPKMAILDETDSGLDIDAIKIVAQGLNQTQREFGYTALLITHYQRILEYVRPDKIHLMVAGKIVASGGQELATQIEAEGYQSFT